MPSCTPLQPQQPSLPVATPPVALLHAVGAYPPCVLVVLQGPKTPQACIPLFLFLWFQSSCLSVDLLTQGMWKGLRHRLWWQVWAATWASLGEGPQ